MSDGQGTGLERRENAGTIVEYWDEELKGAEKIMRTWREVAEKINQRYTKESKLDSMSDEFNVLWSNIQVMIPEVYSREPIPLVRRRYRDKDVVGRIAAEMLERAIRTDMENDERAGHPMHGVLDKAALDMLLIARGVAWNRYDPEILGEGDESQLVSESSPVEFIGMEEFLHKPVKTWEENVRSGWVARMVNMTRDEGLRRFGDIFEKVPLKEHRELENTRNSGTPVTSSVLAEAAVWEIWDAERKEVIWICREYRDQELDRKDDPLGLDGFFPCPCPAYSSPSNTSLIPTPDFSQYQPLANELDRITKKINRLTKALRVAGYYDQSMEGLAKLLQETNEEDKLISVAGMSSLAGKGGLQGVVQYLPMKEIAETIAALYAARQETKNTIYEVTGISDIMRGQVNQYEKLGQSQLKANNANRRIAKRKESIEMLAVGLLRRKAEIIAEHYSPELIRELSGFDRMSEIRRLRENAEMQLQQQAQQTGQPPPPGAVDQYIDNVFKQMIGLIRDDRLRGFVLEIETNSTVLANESEEQERRNQFLESSASFLREAVVAAQQVPQIAPLLGEMMLFGVRGFRTGRSLESAFEDAIESMRQGGGQGGQDQQAQQQQQEQQQAQVAAQMEQAKMQAEMQIMQAKTQADMQKTSMEAKVKMMDAEAKLRAIREKTQSDQQKAQIDQALTAADMQVKILDLEIEREKLEMQMAENRQKALLNVGSDSGDDS